MRSLEIDLSIYSKFNFDNPPVGIKFMYDRPDGIEQLSLSKSMSFCERVREAQKCGIPFYISKENEEECVGKLLLGMDDLPPFAESGQIGLALEIFQEARANQRLYEYIPKFGKGTVNYVVFSPFDKLTFEPDVLVITANPSQAEIIMRAMTYSTGEMWNSSATPVMGCAWSYIYPYKTGKVNYLIPEMIHGMRARKVFPEGSILISIPYQWIPVITKNLSEMQWVLPSYTDKEAYLKDFQRIVSKFVQEAEDN